MPFTYEDVQDTLIDLVTKLYLTPECECGGPLHIVLDDYNTDDNDVLWCLTNMNNPEFNRYSDEAQKLCYQIGGLLLMIPEKERLELVSAAWFYAAHALNKENQNGRFLKKKTQVVEPGEAIKFESDEAERIGTFEIHCSWIENHVEYEGTWFQEASNMEKAYNIWRELFWMDMFDPLYRRIISFGIKRYC